MQSQEGTRSAYNLSKNILSINVKINYVAVADIFGEITDVQSRAGVACPSEQELSATLHKLALATSMLTFENFKLLVVEKDYHKFVIINLEQDSIIVGMRNDTTLSDLLEVIGALGKVEPRQ